MKGKIFIFSDATYVIDGFNDRLDTWNINGWKNYGSKHAGKTIKNMDEWKQIHEYKRSLDLSFRYVKSYGFDYMHNLADKKSVRSRA